MPPSHQLDVLYEDNHLLAVSKPAELVTMGARPGVPTLLEIAREYIREKYNKPGNVYLGVVSRLDGPVTGVVIIARTSKAAARLTEQFRERTVSKTYWALVAGRMRLPEGELVDYLAEHPRHRKMQIVGSRLSGAKEARLAYRTLRLIGDDSLVEIDLATGRKHQIRLQMSHHGHPIIGDRKYGSGSSLARGIALHSRRLVIAHPTRGEEIEIVAPLPAYWPLADADVLG